MQLLYVFLCVSSLQCTQHAQTRTLCWLIYDRFYTGFRPGTGHFGPLLPRNGPAAPLDSLLHPFCASLRRYSAWMDLPASDERPMSTDHSGCSSQFFAPLPFCSPHALETPPQSRIRRYPSRRCFSPAQRALSRAFDRCMAARASHCAPPPKR
jgi:hypothetical protein